MTGGGRTEYGRHHSVVMHDRCGAGWSVSLAGAFATLRRPVEQSCGQAPFQGFLKTRVARENIKGAFNETNDEIDSFERFLVVFLIKEGLEELGEFAYRALQ